MKLLLVNPNVLNPPVFPAGMEYTAEHLIKHERHDVSILDMNLSELSDRRPECHAAGLVQYFSFEPVHHPQEGFGA